MPLCIVTKTDPSPIYTRYEQYVYNPDGKPIALGPLLFDSGTTIASLTYMPDDDTTYRATLEVNGDVDLSYKGIRYTRPSEFPDELKQAIIDTKGDCLRNDKNIKWTKRNTISINVIKNNVPVKLPILILDYYTIENHKFICDLLYKEIVPFMCEHTLTQYDILSTHIVNCTDNA